MKNLLMLFSAVLMCFLCGCDSFRFAPTETQKQNAWLHKQTVEMVDEGIQRTDASEEVKALSDLSTVQSESFVDYYGMPEEPSFISNPSDMLTEVNAQIARKSLQQSSKRPDFWNLADSGLELAIAVSALLGGVYGTRAVGLLKLARQKSQALKEIVQGNEILKNQNSTWASDFKKAHAGQSAGTKQLVTKIRSER